MTTARPSPVLPNALQLPIFKLLQHRRVILASASPRRKDIFETAGFKPEIIPSTFAEDLPKDQYAGNLADYPIATAGEKAIEVYERLVQKDDRDPPDLVISADTVVIYPPEAETSRGGSYPGQSSEVMEKPVSEDDQKRMLISMGGKECEVITGVTIVIPAVDSPGYKLHSMSCSTICHFYDHTNETIQAYIDSKEGIDRAGGFAIQGLGGLLIESIEGNYDNVMGFPSAPFWKWMGELMEDGTFEDAWE